MIARFLNLTSEQYFAGEGADRPYLSYSIAKRLLGQSPLHAWTFHPLLGKMRRDSTKAMEEGDLLHAMLLGEGSKQIDVIDAKDFRTNAAREARDNATAAGFVPVLRKHYEALVSRLGTIRDNLAAAGVVLEGASEATFEWEEETDDGALVLCRARMDKVIVAAGQIIDIKKAASAHPDDCGKHSVDYGYDIQRAAYTRALQAVCPDLAGRIVMKFAFIELAPPFAVCCLPFSGMLRAMGEMKWRRAVNLWHQCVTTNTWPSYPTTGQLECKPWQVDAEAAAMMEDKS